MSYDLLSTLISWVSIALLRIRTQCQISSLSKEHPTNSHFEKFAISILSHIILHFLWQKQDPVPLEPHSAAPISRPCYVPTSSCLYYNSKKKNTTVPKSPKSEKLCICWRRNYFCKTMVDYQEMQVCFIMPEYK